MITLIAHVAVPDANAAAFEALMAEVCAQVRRHEPGVAYYACARSVQQIGTYVIIEVYHDAAAHALHMASAWVLASTPRAIALMAQPPDIRQYVSAGAQPIRLRGFGAPA